MEFLKQVLDFILHINVHLNTLTADYGMWIYGILFLIIFVETGVVIMPFLPGDSLLFAAGALIAGSDNLNLWLMGILLFVAAVLGDTLNYIIGKTLGRTLLSKPSKWIKQEYLLRTQQYYETHGGKTIIFARFIPIIRTFAPFVAGIGAMNYSKFIIYNLAGGFAWIFSFLLLGYFFGNMPFVKSNFTYVIFGIIILSVLPAIVEYIKAKRTKKVL
jgi:membrane-associated protein